MQVFEKISTLITNEGACNGIKQGYVTEVGEGGGFERWHQERTLWRSLCAEDVEEEGLRGETRARTPSWKRI